MHEMASRIRYSEIASDNQLKLSALLNYFQDSGTFETEDLGMTLDFFQEVERVWVLVSWQVVIDRLPRLGEEVIVGTFPYGFKGIMGMRNYYMKEAKSGVMLAKANGIWTLVDTKKHGPARITTPIVERFSMEPKLEMEYAPRKIAIEGEEKRQEPFRVRKERIDTNGHINNSQYVAFAEEYLPQGMQIGQVRVEYKKEAKWLEQLFPTVYENEAKTIITFDNEAGERLAIVEVK